MPTNQRPVLIAFDLPDAEADNPAAPTSWKIQLNEGVGGNLGSTTGAAFVGGDITIDGFTQGTLPDSVNATGRTDAPPVLIESSTQVDRFTIDGNNNTVRGIAFQYLRVLFTGNNNLIEETWHGLNDDGTDIYLVNNDPQVDNRASLEDFEASTGNIYPQQRDHGRTGQSDYRARRQCTGAGQLYWHPCGWHHSDRRPGTLLLAQCPL
ncbi:MAG: hypothetical protein HC828_16830 [Blastochloris sp.]|nr:hypothetical protein [Blastochloris sp.]